MKHHYITGVAGFIGSQLADALLADGERVSGIDDFSLGRREYLVHASAYTGFRLIEGDCGDFTTAIAALEKVTAWEGVPDVIWHLAANSDISAGVSDPQVDFSRTLATTFATLEAARLLKSLGWTPKRTLTFILFTGEEQGGVGARTFLKNHASEIGKMDAALIDDTGTGHITSISLENFWSTGPLMQQVYRPLQEVFDLDPMSTQYFGSSDHVEFQRAGVAGYFAVQEAAHYGYAHHSTDDVFEIVNPEALKEQAALLAAWMWNVSEMPESFPRHPKAPEQRPM